MPKVLIAVTSVNIPFTASGEKTGIFYPEVAHPVRIFLEAGFDFDLVSETGTAGFDERSLEPPFLEGDELEAFREYKDANNIRKLVETNVKKASEVNSFDYDFFFAAGGHGCIIDYPKAKNLQKLALEIYLRGSVVAAICHGPSIFENLNFEDGSPLIKGKTITGFTDYAEGLVGVDEIIKKGGWKTPKAVADKEGAIYVSKGDWDDFAIESDRIVTGTNPQSAATTAQLALKTFLSLR